MDLIALHSFVQTVLAGSLTGAARQLGVPKSTISRRLRRLEEELGLQLIQRSSRSFAITDHGRRLYHRAAPALREIDDAERGLADHDSEPRGLLRLTTSYALGSSSFFAKMIGSFSRRWPMVDVEVEVTDRLIDLIDEGLDIALRPISGPMPDADGLMIRSLVRYQVGLFASPDYLSLHPPFTSPKALIHLNCVGTHGYGNSDGWRLKKQSGTQNVHVAVRCGIQANSVSTVLQVTLAGGGIGLVPLPLADPYVDTGHLVHVLPEWVASEGRLVLIWPASRFLAPRVRAFIDHVTEPLEQPQG